MLREFMYKHDADFVLLQEVTNVNTINIRGYLTVENIGTTERGQPFSRKWTYNYGELTLQRGVTGTARMLHALTHSSISRQVREQM